MEFSMIDKEHCLNEKLKDKKAQLMSDEIDAKRMVIYCIEKLIDEVRHCSEMISEREYEAPEILNKILSYLEEELKNIDSEGQKLWEEFCEYRDNCDHEFEFQVESPDRNERFYICKKCGKVESKKYSEK